MRIVLDPYHPMAKDKNWPVAWSYGSVSVHGLPPTAVPGNQYYYVYVTEDGKDRYLCTISQNSLATKHGGKWERWYDKTRRRELKRVASARNKLKTLMDMLDTREATWK